MIFIEVSFFPFDDTDRDLRNGCLGRALLEINIPEEDLFLDDRTIEIDPPKFPKRNRAPFMPKAVILVSHRM